MMSLKKKLPYFFIAVNIVPLASAVLITYFVDHGDFQKTILLGTTLQLLVCYFLGKHFFNRNLNILSQLKENISLKTFQVNHTLNLLEAATKDINQSTANQASMVNETSSTVEGTSKILSLSSENIKDSSVATKNSQGTVFIAKESVSQMMTAMEAISKSNEQIVEQIEVNNREVSQILQVISEIAGKTKVIDDIVFQTKLLSFNASVEAARAGEHGRGFSVVAGEVGKLAAMSGNSAAEIRILIERSVIQVREVVEKSNSQNSLLTKSSIQKINNGSVSAKKCDDLLNEIVGQVSEVSFRVDEMTTASEDGLKGIAEVSKAISGLEESLKKNQSTSLVASDITRELKSRLSELNGIIQSLESLVDGGTPQKKSPKGELKSIVTSKAEEDIDIAS